MRELYSLQFKMIGNIAHQSRRQERHNCDADFLSASQILTRKIPSLEIKKKNPQ